MRRFTDTIFREIQNTSFMFSKFFFRKSCSLRDNVEKCNRFRYDTDKNMRANNTAHALFMLETEGHRNPLRILNTY
jgi:hypothetical protein